MKQLLGWSASAILLLTIGAQIYRQWKSGTSKGVSKWLFLGQIAASIGFLAYSILLRDVVYITSNILMLLSSFVGLGILLHHRRRERKSSPG